VNISHPTDATGSRGTRYPRCSIRRASRSTVIEMADHRRSLRLVGIPSQACATSICAWFTSGTSLKARSVSVLVPAKLTSPSVSKATMSQIIMTRAAWGVVHDPSDRYTQQIREQLVSTSRGSHSFGAKNNDPLEVLVCSGLFERLSWPGCTRRTAAVGKTTQVMGEIPR
jgi:hypothetical protein